MSWIRTSWLDLVVTAFVAIATLGHVTWARWLVGGYTALMVLLKVIGASSGFVQQRIGGKEEAPPWFYHLLYAANFGLCLFDRWWWVAAGWAVIWVLSALAFRSTPSRDAPKSGKRRGDVVREKAARSTRAEGDGQKEKRPGRSKR